MFNRKNLKENDIRNKDIIFKEILNNNYFVKQQSKCF